MQKRCKGKRQDGERCSSWTLSGSEYCWFHDPELEEQRKAARANGGRNSRVYNRHLEVNGLESVEFRLGSLKELSSFLEYLINMTLQRRVDTKLASTLNNLAVTLRGCLEVSEIERKLERLEAIVNAK